MLQQSTERRFVTRDGGNFAIQLFERLMFPPQVGDSELWIIEGTGHQVMVQPNSGETQGSETSLTFQPLRRHLEIGLPIPLI